MYSKFGKAVVKSPEEVYHTCLELERSGMGKFSIPPTSKKVGWEKFLPTYPLAGGIELWLVVLKLRTEALSDWISVVKPGGVLKAVHRGQAETRSGARPGAEPPTRTRKLEAAAGAAAARCLICRMSFKSHLASSSQAVQSFRAESWSIHCRFTARSTRKRRRFSSGVRVPNSAFRANSGSFDSMVTVMAEPQVAG
jgi:hypothetical protein